MILVVNNIEINTALRFKRWFPVKMVGNRDGLDGVEWISLRLL